jgi:hypothetical protein
MIGLMAVWMAGPVFAQNSPQGSGASATPSGFAMVSTWHCPGGRVTLQLENGPTYTASYGLLGAALLGLCDATTAGETVRWNWHQLGDGSATLQAFTNAGGFTLQMGVGSQAAGSAAGSPRPSLESRLRELQELRAQQLITPEEYYEKRAELLKGL